MSGNMRENDRLIFTIGHSNHTLEEFMNLLQAHRIEYLVDVRSHPYSKYASHFSRQPLLAAVKAAGIKYRFAGKEMGGQPNNEEFYDSDGFVLYSRLAQSQPFVDGISLIEEEIPKYRIAILCSEEDPNKCHRRLLVGRVLAEKGVKVFHIRKDGSIVAENELSEQEAEKQRTNQLSLFEEEEKTEWKSTQSVLPKDRRPSSSER